MDKIKELLNSLTLEEKAGLTSGKDTWVTKAVERLGIPSVRTSDGPHGLRTEMGGKTLEAVCFPTASATAASFDRKLLKEIGTELGRESREKGVNILLGPGINMKRSPLCGRNFEYFSEDPMLAGELGAAFVEGVQSQGVGTSLKHYFANSQEHRRMDSTSEMDDRTAREIYLSAFETVVKKAQPWTIMASYNKIGGTYSTANKKYLEEVLRKEWGFEGVVVSDWGATHDRVGAIKAGCDITMPAENTDKIIVDAVNNGKLSMEELDICCERILKLVYKCVERFANEPEDFEKGHAAAKKAAENSIVLLKNNGLLPLKKSAKVAFIGGFAKMPRFQGGGSSHVNSCKVTNAYDTAVSMGCDVTYAQGYPGEGMDFDETMANEAVELAKKCDVAVVFAGLPNQMETEGADRRHMRMPEAHNALIEAVCEANPNTVVVLHNGAPIEMPWIDKPAAVLEAYLGGQAIGEVTAEAIYGDINPCGHLAESFPVKLSDNPSYLYYFGEGDRVEYREGVFIGYRYYTSKDVKTLYPFGHGLSYTTFEYSDLAIDKSEMLDTDTVTASVSVTNTGNMAGKALVQLYVCPPRNDIIRPVRELKGFEKAELAPGETKRVSFTLSKRDFAHWGIEVSDWRVESGEYKLQICENAETVMLEVPIKITATQLLKPFKYSLSMSIGEFIATDAGKEFADANIGHMLTCMARIGFIPGEIGEKIKSMSPESIDLKALGELSGMVSSDAVGTDGLVTLCAQPLSTMAAFIPEENRNKLNALIEKLNKK